jgi:hypothetical protein
LIESVVLAEVIYLNAKRRHDGLGGPDQALRAGRMPIGYSAALTSS